MNIVVIGTGYVGLVSGACFAEMGNNVVCVDIDANKIEKLKQGIMPIYEPGLEELVKKNYQAQRLHFVSSLQELKIQPTIFFIAVGTPSNGDGSADLQYVLTAAKDIGKYIKDYAIIVNKSTVPVTTAEKVKVAIQHELQQRKLNLEFDVVSNPEFLKEGNAVNDAMRPDRVIVGADSTKARDVMRKLYAPFTRNRERIIFMGVRDAEMTKYAANAILATKISFMNEIANICEFLNVDVENIRQGIGSDSRIGFSFIYPGCGYGGSCFPKDVRALIHTAKDCGFESKVLSAVDEMNRYQKQVMAKKIIAKFGEDLSNLTIGMWGLAFKPETDDMREASSIDFLYAVIERGATIKAYDPIAMPAARKILPTEWFEQGVLQLVEHQHHAIKNADVLALFTEWKQFRHPNFAQLRTIMRGNLILDGRNQYDPQQLRDLGFQYIGIGR
ncbi:MAG: UDP-glucose/GDP-mannose dehydrogenase family protein [Gammaproteobacteria bacterium]